MSDNQSSNITSNDTKDEPFLTSKNSPIKLEAVVKSEPRNSKPLNTVPYPPKHQIQLPRLKPKPPPVVIVSTQVQCALFCGHSKKCYQLLQQVLNVAYSRYGDKNNYYHEFIRTVHSTADILIKLNERLK